MTEYQLTQPLTEWHGDVSSLIAEMKRRAAVETDQELASYMGLAQSTVSHWRKRGRISQPTLLRFEKLVASGPAEPDASTAIAARMVAIRLADYWADTVGNGEVPGRRFMVFGTIAGAFNSVTDQIYAQLVKHERETGLNAWAIAERMMDDDAFLAKLTEWVGSISLAQGLSREAKSPPTVRVRAPLEFPNPVSQSSKATEKPK